MNLISASSAAFALLLSASAFAQAPIHVLASNGVKGVVEKLQPQMEHAAGHPLAIQYGTTASFRQKIAAGEPFDLVLLTSEAVDDLAKEGKVAAASRTSLARCGVGIGIRQGATKPDIGTPAALKQALLNAKSITYVAKGASRHTIEAALAHLGIADQMKAKTQLAQASGPAGESVANGQAQMLITLVSEIVTVHGVELVGPLPNEVQGYIHFSAGVGAKAENAEGAKKVIQFLSSSAAAPTYKSSGMEVH